MTNETYLITSVELNKISRYKCNRFDCNARRRKARSYKNEWLMKLFQPTLERPFCRLSSEFTRGTQLCGIFSQVWETHRQTFQSFCHLKESENMTIITHYLWGSYRKYSLNMLTILAHQMSFRLKPLTDSAR